MNLKKANSLFNIFIILLLHFSLNFCERNSSIEPDFKCIDDMPVEDTSRVYISPRTGNTLTIYPKMIYARFYPWVTDTTKILELLDKHNLRLWAPLDGIDQQLEAVLCITDNHRSEYHFTPYGKEGFCNFGADSLVEYSFAIFNDGATIYPGNILFQFEENTPTVRIDSLFDSNGLRLIKVSVNGQLYRTIVTPKAKKNVLDLTIELKSVPFIKSVDEGIYSGGTRKSCN